MQKILLTLLFIFPTNAYASICQDREAEMGRAIRSLFFVMRELYLEQVLPHYVMDAIMSDVHLEFNGYYKDKFNVASRTNPSTCLDILNEGYNWLDQYKVIVINEISQ